MTTREKVRLLFEQGLTGAQIAKRLNVSTPTVTHHKKMLGMPLQKQDKHIDWGKVQGDLQSGHSYRKISHAHGIAIATISRALRLGKVARNKFRKEMSDSEYAALFDGLRATPNFRYRMRHRLIKSGLAKDACASCGLSEWMGQRLLLELDHIDGHSTNNTISNFRLLCLNCHSQTPTWRGRNAKWKKKLK